MLFAKKNTASVDFTRTKKELAYATRVALGHRSVGQLLNELKMVDSRPLLDLLNCKIKELPDRQLLRKIANASQGRITFQHLYGIVGYSEHDPEEDRSWAKWVPQWGSVYMCDLGIGEDSLQGGKRPVIVIQNNKGNQHSPNVSIIPISSKNKFKSFLHITLEKSLGFEKTSFAFAEMPMTISKRRFFYNTIPYKITTLPEEKMEEIKYALEKQFGFSPLMFDENQAFKMVEHIKTLQENIKVKRSHNLVDLLDEKFNELIEYCKKYHKDHKFYIQEYDRLNNYAYQAI